MNHLRRVMLPLNLIIFIPQSQGDIGPAGPPGNATYQQNRSPYGPPVSAEAARIGPNLGMTFKCHLSQQSEP